MTRSTRDRRQCLSLPFTVFPTPHNLPYLLYQDERVPTRISRLDGARYSQFSQAQLHDVRSDLEGLSRCIERVARSTEPAFEFVMAFRTRRVKLSGMAKDLWQRLSGFHVPMEALSAIELQPYLAAGVRYASAYADVLRWHMSDNKVPFYLNDASAVIIASLYSEIRRECTDPNFKSRLGAIKRLSARRYDACVAKVLRALRYHEQVDVVRLDLRLEGEALMEADALRHRQYFNRFLNTLQDGGAVKGLIWHAGLPSVDIADGRFYRILVLNEPGVSGDASTLPEALGQMWVTRCVGGPGMASYRHYPLVAPELGNPTRVHRGAEKELRALQHSLFGFCRHDDIAVTPRASERDLRSGQVRLGDMPSAPGVDTSRDTIVLAARILKRLVAR